MANVLKAHGVAKGDRVTIYLPMIPRGGLRHAGLRADRGDPFGDLRRLLARLHRRAHPGLRLAAS